VKTQFGKQSPGIRCFNGFLDVKKHLALRHMGHLLNNPHIVVDLCSL